MNKRIGWNSVLKKIEPWLQGNRRVWLTATGIAGIILLLRVLGVLESFELAAFDQLLRLRRSELQDDRIILVYIDDDDIEKLGSWPIPDRVMASAIESIRQQSPRVIGLDIYRDLPVGTGSEQLQETLETTPNLIGIEKRTDAYVIGVKPPEILKQRDQIGFNDVLVDDDGRVRRSLIYLTDDEGFHTSFALKLAQVYLAEEGITPHGAERGNPEHLQLGDSIFSPLNPNDGAYIRFDNGGYQILTNFHSHHDPFREISFSDVLDGHIPDGLMHDRIVLIGSRAKSLQDFFYTPLSGTTPGHQRMPGIKLHAHFVHQIISAAIDGRKLIRVLPSPIEWIWIVIWSFIGASLSWKMRSPIKTGGYLVLSGIGLIGICFFLLILGGWWIPIVPPMFALVGSAIGITSYLAHLEGELQKSKEFLSSVINTIPDPIFVKDKHYRWIVVNEAYSQFIGKPMQALVGKDEHYFLPAHQAEVLQQQDEAAFVNDSELENEGEFTNNIGQTYIISIKRSLHKDLAGNIFLVGVIHDITRLKRMENELRRTAAELVQSNAELRQKGAHLREIAYHDSLTGLPNRKFFHEQLMQAIDWAGSNKQLIAVLFVDLDGFKKINDSEGHIVGDALLRAAAKRLSGTLRSSDTVARLGGDEFVVILPGIPSQEKAGQVAQKLLSTLSEIFMFDNKGVSITASIGISIYPFDGTSLETLVVESDQAMYRAKQKGKNRFEFTSQHHTVSITSKRISSGLNAKNKKPMEVSTNE